MSGAKWPGGVGRITIGSAVCLSAEVRCCVHISFLFLAVSLSGHALIEPSNATNGFTAEIRDTSQGRFVYMQNCVPCHGFRGDGKGEMGLTLKPPPRDFGAGVFKYRSTPSGSLPTNDDLARTVRKGLPDTAMPAFTALSARDVSAVIEYVKTFSTRWRNPQNYAAPVPIAKRPVWFDDATEF